MSEFIVIGKRDCKWCDEAFDLLLRNRQDFTYYPADTNDEGKTLVEVFGFKTVPQVFHGTKYIGGFTDLRTYLEKQELPNGL